MHACMPPSLVPIRVPTHPRTYPTHPQPPTHPFTHPPIQSSLRGAETESRSLFVANYGGKAYNGRYPVNACFNFYRYPTPTFTYV